MAVHRRPDDRTGSNASDPDPEVRIRRLGLRCRVALRDPRPTVPGQTERGDDHEATVWDPKTRTKGSGRSDRSASDALAAALATFQVAVAGIPSPARQTRRSV